MIEPVVVIGGTFLLGLITCRLGLRLVTRLRMWDVPNVRSSHALPVPRGGGLGILMGLLPGAVGGYLLLRGGGVGPWEAATLGCAVVLVLGAGWLDDRRGAGPAVKMTLQAAAGLLVVVGVGRIENIALTGESALALGVLAGPLTLFWLVGFSNGFNFMDGIDGIAALNAGVAALAFSAAAVASGAEGLLWLSLPLAGASFAFLSVNLPPAKVFMGDSGSLPLGFLLAGLVVLGCVGGRVPFLTGFLILGPFLFDTLFTLLRRLVRGENILKAHRSHLYQRLALSGLSHGVVASMYGAWSFLSGGLGLLYLSGDEGLRWLSLCAALALGLLVVLYVSRREGVREGNDA